MNMTRSGPRSASGVNFLRRGNIVGEPPGFSASDVERPPANMAFCSAKPNSGLRDWRNRYSECSEESWPNRPQARFFAALRDVRNVPAIRSDWPGRNGCEGRTWPSTTARAAKKSHAFTGTQGGIAVNDLRCIQITSIDQLRAAAPARDDLWWRSAVETPLAPRRIAGPMARTLPDRRRAFRRRWSPTGSGGSPPCRWSRAASGRLIPAGAMPSNPWAVLRRIAARPGGRRRRRLRAADGRDRGDSVATPLARRRSSPSRRAGKRSSAGPKQAGLPASFHHRLRVGRVEINQPWDVVPETIARESPPGHGPRRRGGWPAKATSASRCTRARTAGSRPLAARGARRSRISAGRATLGHFRAPLGQHAGLFRPPGRATCPLGQLETAAVRLDGQMIAFIYGMRAKGVYFAVQDRLRPAAGRVQPGSIALPPHPGATPQRRPDARAGFHGPVEPGPTRGGGRPPTGSVASCCARAGRLGGAALFAYQRLWRRLTQWRRPAARRPARARRRPRCRSRSVSELIEAVERRGGGKRREKKPPTCSPERSGSEFTGLPAGSARRTWPSVRPFRSSSCWTIRRRNCRNEPPPEPLPPPPELLDDPPPTLPELPPEVPPGSRRSRSQAAPALRKESPQLRYTSS